MGMITATRLNKVTGHFTRQIDMSENIIVGLFIGWIIYALVGAWIDDKDKKRSKRPKGARWF
jgi:hypothetical protein